eukprot:c594_g1_i1.p1 GENE.c594_g1_i1~~c594_g1_i1.p1  ORF type:complete len:182 (+),score=23.56 c594_g1_i1:39-584(+)
MLGLKGGWLVTVFMTSAFSLVLLPPHNKAVVNRVNAARDEASQINLQVLPASRPKDDPTQGGTKMIPIEEARAASLGKSIIHGEGLPSNVDCHLHMEITECLYDVECGWCIGASGSFCTEGSASGPCDQNVVCPVYQTYQQPGMGSHDCGTGTNPCTADEEKALSQELWGDTIAAALQSQQ